MTVVPHSLDPRRLRRADTGVWEILGGYCPSCQIRSFPMTTWCTSCGAECTEFVLRPTGEVQLASVVHASRPGCVLPPPFASVLVQLDQGPVLTVLGPADGTMRRGVRVRIDPFVVELDSDHAVVLTAEVEGTSRG